MERSAAETISLANTEGRVNIRPWYHLSREQITFLENTDPWLTKRCISRTRYVLNSHFSLQDPGKGGGVISSQWLPNGRQNHWIFLGTPGDIWWRQIQRFQAKT